MSMHRSADAQNVFFRFICRAAEGWREYHRPHAVLQALHTADVLPVLAAVDAAVAAGRIAAGFVTYEAASAFDSSLTTQERGTLPLVCFGLFEGWSTFTWPLASSQPAPLSVASDQQAWRRVPWTLATDHETYRQRLAHIREALRAGRVYQVNHTERLYAQGVDPFTLFLDVAEQARYGAYIETPDFAVVSTSPELLFELNGDVVVCKPMKGTAVRSPIVTKDPEQAMWLRTSEKNRAENVMITDMVRHDLGRIARTGSVQVTELFGIERLAHVWQMTSTVKARTDATIPEIFRALVPGASVTGAPKSASMRVIRELESAPREIYTGAIGVMEPGRKARFSIAIRTAWFDRQASRGTYGAGGGIVWDSDPDEEWQELAAKARVVNQPIRRGFGLIETLRYSVTDGYFLRQLHRDRLAHSAEWFNRPFDLDGFDRLLDQGARDFNRNKRVRVMLDDRGRLSLQATMLMTSVNPVMEIMLATLPAGIDPVLLHHKTTLRSHYDPRSNGDEVLLCNREGRVTESSIANVVFEVYGRKYTPPLEDGLLGGVYRQHLIDQGLVELQSLSIESLQNVERLWLVNALRGEREVISVTDTQGSVLYRKPENPS